jgi:hypothetical protein
MALEQFVETIQPPTKPVENGKNEDWIEVEQALKTKLPSDYKNYINIFGTGCLFDFIWVFNPFSKNSNLNLYSQIKLQLDAIIILEKEFDERCPYPIYPVMGGLLPWGITNNGDIMFWFTKGEPNFWTTAIHESRGSKYETFEASLTNFIIDLNFGKIMSEIIPIQLLDRNAKFKSIA